MDDDDAGSYRMAVSPALPDDGLTSEGKPRAIRYKKQILNELNQDMQLEEHKLTVEEICEALQTDPEFGLMHAQAKAILDRDGLNILDPEFHEPSFLKKWFSALFHGSAGILFCLASLLLILNFVVPDHQKPADLATNTTLFCAMFLFLCTILIAAFRLYEQSKTAALLQTLRTPSSATCTVIRETQRFSIAVSDLAAGDLLELRAGEKVPADVRLIRCGGFKVDCAELTGDSQPQSRNGDYSSDSAFEAKNLCLAGSIVTEGSGQGVVIATGPRTVQARLEALATSLTPRETPTALELRTFFAKTCLLPIVASIVIYPLCLSIGFTWYETTITLFGLTLAALPCSLLCVANLAFSLSVRRMAARCIFVRRPKALEALGQCDLMLLDKTGTITQNKLTVRHFWFDGRLHEAQLSEAHTGAHPLSAQPSFLVLSLAVILCNSAEFVSGQAQLPVQRRKTVHGNAVEAALLKCMELVHGQSVEKRNAHPRRVELPFSASTKVHVCIHELELNELVDEAPALAQLYPRPSGGPHLLVLKGAPEKILDRCSSLVYEGRTRHLDDKRRAELNAAFTQMCQMGERVVAFADLWLPSGAYPHGYAFDIETLNFPLIGVRFLGFVSMLDPPRTCASDAISRLKESGVKMILTTGDHSITAKSMARTVGILNADSETVEEIAMRKSTLVTEINPNEARLVVTNGGQLSEMSDSQLDKLIKEKKDLIFARMEPQQKLRLVENLQKMGFLVAAVGDGVNDLPMLRKADVSIGLAGAEQVQRLADILLLDNNFANLVVALREGRSAGANLRKACAFLLCANTPQVVAFITCMLTGLPAPLSIGAVLLIDFAMDVLPAIGLCYEPNEETFSNYQTRKVSVDLEQTEVPSPMPPMRKSVDTKVLQKKKKLRIAEIGLRSRWLFDTALVSFSYLQIGAIETAAGFFTYFVIMAQNGFWMSDLWWLRQSWDSEAINDLKDSVGQEWNFDQRKALEFTCQTGFFFTVLSCQLITAITCKTRKTSLFNVKMENDSLNFALVFEIVLALFLIYMPGISSVFNLTGLCISWLFIPLPFVGIIFLYSECLKYILRKNPSGWVEQELFY